MIPVLLDYATARALLDTLERLSATDPAVRALRDRLWDAIIDAKNRGVEEGWKPVSAPR